MVGKIKNKAFTYYELYVTGHYAIIMLIDKGKP